MTQAFEADDAAGKGPQVRLLGEYLTVLASSLVNSEPTPRSRLQPMIRARTSVRSRPTGWRRAWCVRACSAMLSSSERREWCSSSTTVVPSALRWRWAHAEGRQSEGRHELQTDVSALAVRKLGKRRAQQVGLTAARGAVDALRPAVWATNASLDVPPWEATMPTSTPS